MIFIYYNKWASEKKIMPDPLKTDCVSKQKFLKAYGMQSKKIKQKDSITLRGVVTIHPIRKTSSPRKARSRSKSPDTKRKRSKSPAQKTKKETQKQKNRSRSRSPSSKKSFDRGVVCVYKPQKKKQRKNHHPKNKLYLLCFPNKCFFK